MKRFRKFIIVFLLVIPILLVLSSCQVISNTPGKSAYDIAVEHGFTGSEEEWLASLKGEKGDSLKIEDLYEAAKASGFQGDFLSFVSEYLSTTQIEGKSAYDIAVDYGFTGSEEEWLASLKGEAGMAGADGTPGDKIDLYDVYIKLIDLKLIPSSLTYLEFVQEYTSLYSSITSNNSDNQKGISKALLSAVKIVCTDTKIDLWSSSESLSGQSGAGVIYRINKSAGSCYIITNYHVVYSEDNNQILPYIYAFVYGSEYLDSAISAKFIGGSATYDIAVLQITNNDIIKNSAVTAATVYNSNDITVGMTAIAIGNPEGDGISATEGIVCVDSETIEMSPIIKNSSINVNERGMVEMRVIRIDTPVNHGNSGGGLFTANGELMGIVNAKTVSDDVENIGYAIPSSVVVNVVENILANCDGNTHLTMQRCLMGVMITINNSWAVYEDGLVRIEEEVVVASVTSGGVADGILKENDILKSITIGGKTYDITRNFVVIDACLSAKVGDTVTLVIERNGETKAVSMVFNSSVEVI